MAFQTIWYYSDIPEEIVNIMERDLSVNYDSSMSESYLYGGDVNKEKRNSKNTWVPSEHWIGGFMWHYISRANRENFLYDLRCIDGESMQYTQYGPGEFYGWHNDAGFIGAYKPQSHTNDNDRQNDFVNEHSELVRKLSFVLQLSHPDDYEGGNLQLMGETGKCYFAPRKRGTIILFDSRTQHRVLPVKSGLRKSIVGWTVGPRWK